MPPAAIRDFVSRLAVSRSDGVVESAMLDHCVREVLNDAAPRRMGVLRPLRVVIENYPENASEELEIANDPRNPEAGVRRVPFPREIFVERDDFMEDPPRKFFRLAPDARSACARLSRDLHRRGPGRRGGVRELRCVHDPDSRGGNAPDGRKVRGAMHWVSAAHAVDAEVRLYEPLFVEPGGGVASSPEFNPRSLETVAGCKLEPALADLEDGDVVQFERLGYFCRDRDSEPRAPVFNRTIGLRDSFARAMGRGKACRGLTAPARPGRGAGTVGPWPNPLPGA